MNIVFSVGRNRHSNAWLSDILRASSQLFTRKWNQWLPVNPCNRQLLTSLSGVKASSARRTSPCCCFMCWRGISRVTVACLITVQKFATPCIACWSDLDRNARSIARICPSGAYKEMGSGSYKTPSIAQHPATLCATSSPAGGCLLLPDVEQCSAFCSSQNPSPCKRQKGISGRYCARCGPNRSSRLCNGSRTSVP